MRRNSRGAALVEFAIALPLLVTLAMGAVDGARAFSTWNRVKNAAREGAQFAQYFPLRQAPTGSICTAPNNITSRVQAEGTDLSVTVTPTASPSCQDLTTSSSLHAGDPVKVTVSRSFSFFSPVARLVWGNQTIKASVTATVQG